MAWKRKIVVGLHVRLTLCTTKPKRNQASIAYNLLFIVFQTPTHYMGAISK